MAIKTYKPTTPSRRHMTVSAFEGIDKKANRAQPAGEPEEECRPQQLRPHHRPPSRRR